MGSCVSKKAVRSGTCGAKVAPPLPPEKDTALPPVVVVEEVKEVLSETPVVRPRPPEPEMVKEKVRSRQQEHEGQETSDGVSAGSSAAEKAVVNARSEQEVEKRAVDAPEKKGSARGRSPEQRKPKDAGSGRARSPSPASAKRRQGAAGGGEQAAVMARPRREQPAVVSGIGCRSGRFSPSATRRAAESAVRRTYSAREADMMLPASRTAAKRSLNTSINGNNGSAYAGSGVRRDPGERSGRRPDSPTARRPPASPAANGTISRQASARKAAKGNTSPEQTKPQRRKPGEVRDELDEAALPRREHKEAAEGALEQNPSVAMECFIFL